MNVKHARSETEKTRLYTCPPNTDTDFVFFRIMKSEGEQNFEPGKEGKMSAEIDSTKTSKNPSSYFVSSFEKIFFRYYSV